MGCFQHIENHSERSIRIRNGSSVLCRYCEELENS